MAELEITEIIIGYPKNTEKIALELNLAACKVQLQSGEIKYWAEGTYEHPSHSMSPTLEQKEGTIKFSQDFSKLGGLLSNLRKTPSVNLTLSKQKPFSLVLQGGATEADYQLSGLPLTHLKMKTGAGKFVFHFDEPNPEVLESFELETGAAGLEAYGLGHANFRRMKVNGGAAGFKLDFGGELRQDAELFITTGLAGVELFFPPHTAVKIYVETSLAEKDLGEGFLKKDGYWINEAAIAGNSPLLTIRANISLGSLDVKTTA